MHETCTWHVHVSNMHMICICMEHTYDVYMHGTCIWHVEYSIYVKHEDGVKSLNEFFIFLVFFKDEEIAAIYISSYEDLVVIADWDNRIHLFRISYPNLTLLDHNFRINNSTVHPIVPTSVFLNRFRPATPTDSWCLSSAGSIQSSSPSDPFLLVGFSDGSIVHGRFQSRQIESHQNESHQSNVLSFVDIKHIVIGSSPISFHQIKTSTDITKSLSSVSCPFNHSDTSNPIVGSPFGSTPTRSDQYLKGRSVINTSMVERSMNRNIDRSIDDDEIDRSIDDHEIDRSIVSTKGLAVCCDHPTVVFMGITGRLQTTALGITAPRSVFPIERNEGGSTMIGWSGDGLNIGWIDGIQRLQIRTLPLRMSPER